MEDREIEQEQEQVCANLQLCRDRAGEVQLVLPWLPNIPSPEQTDRQTGTWLVFAGREVRQERGESWSHHSLTVQAGHLTHLAHC